MTTAISETLAVFDLDQSHADVVPGDLTQAAWAAIYPAVALARATGSVGTYTQADGRCYYVGRGAGRTWQVRLATPERDGEQGMTYEQRHSAIDEAQVALRATSTRDLLSNAYVLTHKIDSAARSEHRAHRVGLADHLRAQRALIEGEIVRRAGA